MNNHDIKIKVIGHVGSGKSTYAALIALALVDEGIECDVVDVDGDPVVRRLPLPHNKTAVVCFGVNIDRRLKALRKSMKAEKSKVVIETVQVARTKKVV